MKANVLRIPKMWYFSSFKGFEPELLAVKVESNFGKSARFQVPKNGTSSAQIFERTPKTSRNTPQNGGVDIWFIRFHFWASSKPIFENYLFYVCQELFSHYHGPQTSSGLPSGIYGSINLKIVFWALLTTLNMPCDGRKAQPIFFFCPG